MVTTIERARPDHIVAVLTQKGVAPANGCTLSDRSTSCRCTNFSNCSTEELTTMLSRHNYRLSLCLGAMAAFLFTPPTVFCQKEKLGMVEYTPPRDWKKSEKENIVAFSKIDEATGRFCVITLYGATPSAGTPQEVFAKEWDTLVVKPWQAEPKPKTETQSSEGWTTIAGLAPIDFQGSRSIAVLSVQSGFGKAVSVLAIFNDEGYGAKLAAFVASIELNKDVADSPAARREQAMPAAPSANLASMHAAALVKEFELNEVRANQQYVGKRMRIFGTVNTIEIGKDGNIVLTFKSSITTYNNARCLFSKSQSSRVAALSAHEQATVEGTVRGMGGGFDNTKAFLLLENCIVP